MKLFLWFLMLIIPSLIYAETPRSMIQVTTSGLGASGSYEAFATESDSSLDDFDITKGNIAINYSYSLLPQLQLGLFLSNFNEKRSFKNAQGEDGKVEYRKYHIGLLANWNLSTDLYDTYYVGVMLSHMNEEDENSHVEPFDYLEDDRSAQTVDLIFGKRFTLEKWGLKNITYSPTISVFISNSQKDFKDEGIKESAGYSLNLLKFDVLF